MCVCVQRVCVCMCVCAECEVDVHIFFFLQISLSYTALHTTRDIKSFQKRRSGNFLILLVTEESITLWYARFHSAILKKSSGTAADSLLYIYIYIHTYILYIYIYIYIYIYCFIPLYRVLYE